MVNHPEIEIFVVESDYQLRQDYADTPKNFKCYWTRIEGVIDDPTTSWDVWMYEQLHVDFEDRYKLCPIEAAASKVAQIHYPTPYYLLHEDAERGFTINYPPFHPTIPSMRTFRSGDLSILAWVEAMKCARELHFIDSSMWHLAESLNLPDYLTHGVRNNLYIHRYSRLRKPVWHDIRTRYRWQYVGI